MHSSIICRLNACTMMELTSLYERGIKMEVADYRRMNTFELIDRINGTVSWDDEENEPCMRILCERYNIDFDNYNIDFDNYNDEDESIWDYEILRNMIIKRVYNDVSVQHKYSIDDRDYEIISLDSGDRSEFAVVDEVNHRVMFDVYEIGTMRECKNYIKERVDID